MGKRRWQFTPSPGAAALEMRGQKIPIKARDRAAAIEKAESMPWWHRCKNPTAPIYARKLWVFVLDGFNPNP